MKRFLLALVIAGIAAASWYYRPLAPEPWTDAEIEVLQSLWIGNLGPVPPDLSNAVADNPLAAEFGQIS